MRGSLPTNLTRFNHHVSLYALCPLCGAIQESIFHTLRDCPKAKRVWEAMQLYRHFDSIVLNLADWVQASSFCG